MYKAEKSMPKIWMILIAVLTISGAACATTAKEKSDYMALSTKKGSFEDARDAVTFAITERGLVINNVSHIGKMLVRTGKDMGGKKLVYKHAEILEFCSATISRATMEADPHNVVFCPYAIAIYEITHQPGTVYISYRHPEIVGTRQSKKSLEAVEKLLSDIVKSALEW